MAIHPHTLIHTHPAHPESVHMRRLVTACGFCLLNTRQIIVLCCAGFSEHTRFAYSLKWVGTSPCFSSIGFFLNLGLVNSYHLDESIPIFRGFLLDIFVFIAFPIEILYL